MSLVSTKSICLRTFPFASNWNLCRHSEGYGLPAGKVVTVGWVSNHDKPYDPVRTSGKEGRTAIFVWRITLSLFSMTSNTIFWVKELSVGAHHWEQWSRLRTCMPLILDQIPGNIPTIPSFFTGFHPRALGRMLAT